MNQDFKKQATFFSRRIYKTLFGYQYNFYSFPPPANYTTVSALTMPVRKVAYLPPGYLNQLSFSGFYDIFLKYIYIKDYVI